MMQNMVAITNDTSHALSNVNLLVKHNKAEPSKLLFDLVPPPVSHIGHMLIYVEMTGVTPTKACLALAIHGHANANSLDLS